MQHVQAHEEEARLALVSNALRSKYRALSFQPPDTWLAASAVHLGDASEEGGRVVLGIEEELRHPSEGLDAFARRKADALREDRLDVEVLRSSELLVDGRPAWLLRVRYRSDRYPLGPIEHVVVLVDRGDPRSWAVLFMQVLAARFDERAPAWEKLLDGLRFDELAPRGPRIRPHAATFEPPAHWAEEVSYTFRSVGPDAATISVVLEASVGPFGAFVAGRMSELSATNEVLESAPALAVDGRDAARIRTRARAEKAPVEQLLVVVDGGGTGSQRAVFSATAPAGSAALAGAERALLDLVSSVRFGAVEPAPEPRPALEQGASTRNLTLTGKPPTSVHAELMRRGFVPARIPLAASTTRAGQRRFLRTDGHPTASLADPQLATEIVYAHADGGTVRIFPHGNPSTGLGGVEPGSARMSVRYTGSRDVGIDAEEAVIGCLGVHPRSIAPDHLPPDGKDAPVRALRRVRDTWSVLGGRRSHRPADRGPGRAPHHADRCPGGLRRVRRARRAIRGFLLRAP